MEKSILQFRFGPYELNRQTRELYKCGHKLKLRPQPLHILTMLVEHAGEVVTREELRELLWPKETFVDFDHSLNTAIKELRGALNEAASSAQYIETLPKLGYRMMAQVERVEEAAPASKGSLQVQRRMAPALALEKAGELPIPAPGPLGRGGIAAGVLAAVLVGAAVLIAYRPWPRATVVPSTANGRLMIAVLPFENLTGDSGQEYFSDGLTEEMISQLGELDPAQFGVIARTSVEGYKHTHEQLGQISKELGVQYVLEGSVRRDAKQVRVSAQLIQTKDQTHLWAREYDRELINLISLQGEIAQDVAGQIKQTLGGGKFEWKHPTAVVSARQYEAYDLYLEGRYFWNKRTPEGFRRAVECFEKAVAKDPSFARAYAGLADAYALMSGYTATPPEETMPKARAAAEKALRLDEGLAEAHVSLGVIAQNYDWDWASAEREYRRAIQLDPNYATAHHWYAEHLALMGRFDESYVEIEKARQLDPLSLIMAADRGAILYFARKYALAIAQFQEVLEMETDFPRAHMVVYAYVQEGRSNEALAHVGRWQSSGRSPWTWAARAYICGRAGKRAEARRAMEKLQSWRSEQIDPMVFAVAYAGVGDKEQEFKWLDKAAGAHSSSLTALKVDPIYDPFRGDPRFHALMRRMNFAP